MAANRDFTIDVKGDAEIQLPAERAVLSIQANAQGQYKKETTDATLASCRKVEVFLREMTAMKEGQESAVDHWSRTSLREQTH